MAILYIKYYRNICILIIIFVTIVTTAKKPKLSITEDDTTLYCMISDDTTNTAITWDNQDINPSYPLHRDYINITTSMKFNETLMVRELKYINPMLDYRWENLPLVNCSYEIPMKKFSISIKKGNICLDKEPCYTIGNEEYSDINPERDDNKRRCDVKSENQHQKEWKHFTIARNSNEQYNMKQYTAKSQAIKINVTGNNLTVDGICKVHAVYVYIINSSNAIKIEVENKWEYGEACFGLLVKIPADWNVTFKLIDSRDALHINKTTKKIKKWQEIKLCTLGRHQKFNLSIEPELGNSGEEMLIADIIRNYNNDVRISSLTKTSSLHCCYDLVTTTKICSNKLTSYNPVSDSGCPSNTIGINCIPCNKIFNEETCGHHIICDLVQGNETVCSCPLAHKDVSCKVLENCSVDCKCKCANNGRDPLPANVSMDSSTSLRPDRKQAVVYSVGKDNMKLRFEPVSSDKLPCEYKAWWVEHASGVLMNCEQSDSCKIWPGQICIECNNLAANTSSPFQIKYIDGNQTQYEQFQEVTAIVGEKVPSQPKNISHSWNNITNALTLMWNHPDIPNGRITSFSFNILDKQIQAYNISEEQLEYSHTFEFGKLNVNWSSDISVTVFVHNKNGQNETTINISTPPKTPEFVKDPALINITNTSFIINISTLPYINGTISNLYFIVSNAERPPSSVSAVEEEILKCGNITEKNSWIQENISIANIQNNTFEINGNFCISLEENEPKIKCKVLILLENQYNGISRCKTYSIESITGVDYRILLYMIIIPIFGLIVFFVYKLKKSKSDCSNSNDISLTSREALPNQSRQSKFPPGLAIYEDIQETSTGNNKDQMNETIFVRPVYEEVADFPERVEIIDQLNFEESKIWQKYMSTTNSVSRCVKIQELEDYVKVCLKTREFETQYKLFEEGQTKPWTCGVKPENKSKNRYKNLAAYDHSRVKLDIVNNDKSSDYINANYIDGYEVNKAYIATQGPKSNTIVDFWRMIWQKNVEYIVMIANITEEGKKKIERYWPDLKESASYGEFTVTLDEVVVFPVYESKLFRVSFQGKEHIIKHLHFTAWPDQGMPFYPQTLAPFLKRMMTIPLGKSPVVIHCSAGIGRTGTLILCDISLRMAAKRGEIDVFFHLRKLRKQRINMVDNINQYKLVHLVLLHCLVAPDYTIPCTEKMGQIVNDITSHTEIIMQMKYLEDTLWQDEAMRSACTKINKPIIHQKNRHKNIYPDSYARITLSPYPLTDESSTYINAIKVDGFCASSKFIVTQFPLSETVGDIWRLVDEYDISLMISLNELDLIDETCCKFYPEHKESMQPTPFLRIESVDILNKIYYTINTLNINNLQKENQRIIKILHVKEWKYHMLHPKTPTALLMTYEEMRRLENSNNKLLIACHDATRASGLFTAMCCLLDQIKMENVCDVCLAVRTVKHSNAEFVTEMEQFIFLYNCALEYVQEYEKYSKFYTSGVLD